MPPRRIFTTAGWRPALDAVSTITVTLASLVVIWAVLKADTRPSSSSGPPSRPGLSKKTVPALPIPLDGARLLGSPAATLAVIEFSDYQCPFCARFHQASFPGLLKSYVETGKVLFALRHLPLQKHDFAFRAAESAECAGDAGRFWEMHGELFKLPPPIDEPSILAKAVAAQVDTTQLRACLGDVSAAGRIRRDLQVAREAGITGTPTFLIGRVQSDRKVKVLRRESGAIPPGVFARMLDDALRSVSAAGR